MLYTLYDLPGSKPEGHLLCEKPSKSGVGPRLTTLARCWKAGAGQARKTTCPVENLRGKRLHGRSTKPPSQQDMTMPIPGLAVGCLEGATGGGLATWHAFQKPLAKLGSAVSRVRLTLSRLLAAFYGDSAARNDTRPSLVCTVPAFLTYAWCYSRHRSMTYTRIARAVFRQH